MTAIAAGLEHTVALKSDGTVVVWGDNSYGQRTVPGSLSGVMAVAAGVYHTVALRNDGTVVAWGAGTNNTGISPNFGQSLVPAGLSGVTGIAAGGGHVLVRGSFAPIIAQEAADRVVNVGQRDFDFFVIATGLAPLNYQWSKDGTNIPGATQSTYHFDDLTGAQTNQTGGYTVVVGNSFGSVTSRVFSLTVNRLSQTIVFSSLPARRVGEAAFDLYASAGSGLAVTYTSSDPGVASVSGSTLTLVGEGIATITASQIGNATFLPANVSQQQVVNPRPVPPTINAQPVSQIVNVWQKASFTVTAAGTEPFSYQWRKDGINISGATARTNTLAGVQASQAGGYSVVVSNAAGSVTSSPPAVLTVNSATPGTVVAWGDNAYGQTMVPTGLNGISAIAGGGYFTAALKNDGTLVAWGDNSFGESTVPAGLSGVTAVAGGAYHTVALRNDGTVVVWGWNNYGQTNAPSGLSGVTAIAAGDNHTVALKSDGTVVAWGAGTNNTGSFPNFGQSLVPAGLNGISAIAAGPNFTVALKSNGTVVAWGSNYSGQTNVPVTAQSGVTAISAGGGHAIALKNDGAVIAWGNNSDGQTNVPVAARSGVAAIAAGFSHNVALKSNGTVVAWGWNYSGLTTVPSGLIGVARVAAGFRHSVALLGPVFSSQPLEQTVVVGASATLTANASGLPTIAYQWLKDGSPLVNATNAQLTLTNAALSQSGLYTVEVTSVTGSVTSKPALLTVARSLFQPPMPQDAGAIRAQGFALSLLLETGRAFRVQASTDLLGWQDVTNFTSSATAFQFVDGASSNQTRRFYRVFSP